MVSYCSGCGASLAAGARFCSACGKAVTASGFAPGFASGPATPFPGALVRPRAGRKVAGVCQGLANHYGWDVTATRVIAVLLTVLVIPVGLVAYLLFWLIVPEEAPGPLPLTNLDRTI